MFQKEAQRNLIGIERVKNTVFTGYRYQAARAPCDYLLAYQGRAALIDTKTYDCDSLDHSRLEAHQVMALKNMHDHGLIAGYVVWFRKINKVVFFSANILCTIKEDQALKPESGKLLGPIESMNLRSLFDNRSSKSGTSDSIQT
jgi:penicillin-binding protein-related factor A (putative recombinase)